MSSVILVGVIVAAIVGTTASHNSGGHSKIDNPETGGAQSLSASVKAVCDVTLYKDSCYSSLSSNANSTTQSISPQELFKLSIQVAIIEISKAAEHFSLIHGISNIMFVAALENCRDLLALAIDDLNSSMSTQFELNLPEAVDDFKTWLSAVGTYQ